MKCEICNKTVKELYQEPVSPGTDVGTAKAVCLECHGKRVKELTEKKK